MGDAYIHFNGCRSDQIGIPGGYVVAKLLGAVKIPTPQMRYETITIPGRDGVLYEEDAYDDITIPVDLEIQDIDKNEDAIDMAKSWLRNVADNRLYFWYDTRCFYRVNQVLLDDFEREYGRFATFHVDFVCEPYRYQTASDMAINLPIQLVNSYAVSKPVYIISGTGPCTLTVNGRSVTLNVDGELTINTDKQLCYKSNGAFANKAMTGEFSDLFLMPGNNAFSLSAGFAGKIITNMRKL